MTKLKEMFYDLLSFAILLVVLLLVFRLVMIVLPESVVLDFIDISKNATVDVANVVEQNIEYANSKMLNINLLNLL